MSQPTDFTIGQRVQAHPGTDRWMMGDRYGRVTKIGRKYVTVKMEVSGRSIRFAPDRLLTI